MLSANLKSAGTMSRRKPLMIAGLFAGLLLTVQAPFADAASVQWKTADGGNGHLYEIVLSNGIDFTSAMGSATALGGHLATPDLPGEADFIHNNVVAPATVGQSLLFWLGAYSAGSVAGYQWQWVTGGLVTSWGGSTYIDGAYANGGQQGLYQHSINSVIQDAPFSWPGFGGFVVEYEAAPTNLIAAYTFDGNANDTTGNGHNLTISGATLTTGRHGTLNSAYLFNGGTAFLSGALPLPESATFSVWATWNGSPAALGNMLFNTGAVRQGPDLYFYAGNTLWNTWDAAQNPFATIPTSALDGGFHNYTVVVDGLNLNTRLYFDGGLVGTAGYRCPHSQFTLGGAGGSDAAYGGGGYYGWPGVIDDVTVYNTALTAEQVYGLVHGLGYCVQTVSSYDFSIVQGRQQSQSSNLINACNQARSANIAVVNAPSGLAISATPASLNLPIGQTASLTVTVDATQASAGNHSGILLKISADDGNVLYSTINVTVQTAPLPDLAVSASDISLATSTSSSATVTVNVHNLGLAASPQAVVRLFDFGSQVGQTTLAAVPPNGIGSVSFTLSTSGGGDHVIEAVVDPNGQIQESDESNNGATTILRISTPTTPGDILVTASLPSVIYSSSLFTVSGQAIYDVLVGGVRNTSYSVKGGLVQITLVGPDGTSSIFGTVNTDANGYFSQTLQAPALVGAYQMKMSVSDQTLSGTRQLVFDVIALPPAPPPPASPPAVWGTGQWNYVPSPGGSGGGSWTWSWDPGQPSVPPVLVPQSDLRVVSGDIAFSKSNTAANEEITIAAQIHFWSSDPNGNATNVPIDIYVTPAGSTSKVWIGGTTITSLSVGSPDYGSRVVYATWKNQGVGFYIVEVDIDPSSTYTDQVTSNNAATRAIIAGTPTTNMGAITGHVIDPFGGVANAEVDVLDGTGATFASTRADSTGSYFIDQVPAGNYQVRIQPPANETPALNPQQATVTANAIAEVDFVLTTTPSPVPALPLPFLALAFLLVGLAGCIGACRRC